MAESAKEYRANVPNEEDVAVVIIEVEGYGSILIERKLWAQKGGNESVIAKAHGIDSKRIMAVDYSQTRTRDYLNNLPAFSGNK